VKNIFAIKTELGCTIRVDEFEDGVARLSLDMEQPSDGRHAEVLIPAPEAYLLGLALQHWAVPAG
jgi:hypothetical protein